MNRCERCGADATFWERTGVAPAAGEQGKRSFRPQREWVRWEQFHYTGCPLRHPEQPGEPPAALRIV